MLWLENIQTSSLAYSRRYAFDVITKRIDKISKKIFFMIFNNEYSNCYDIAMIIKIYPYENMLILLKYKMVTYVFWILVISKG